MRISPSLTRHGLQRRVRYLEPAVVALMLPASTAVADQSRPSSTARYLSRLPPTSVNAGIQLLMIAGFEFPARAVREHGRRIGAHIGGQARGGEWPNFARPLHRHPGVPGDRWRRDRHRVDTEPVDRTGQGAEPGAEHCTPGVRRDRDRETPGHVRGAPAIAGETAVRRFWRARSSATWCSKINP